MRGHHVDQTSDVIELTVTDEDVAEAVAGAVNSRQTNPMSC